MLTPKISTVPFTCCYVNDLRWLGLELLIRVHLQHTLRVRKTPTGNSYSATGFATLLQSVAEFHQKGVQVYFSSLQFKVILVQSFPTSEHA